MPPQNERRRTGDAVLWQADGAPAPGVDRVYLNVAVALRRHCARVNTLTSRDRRAPYAGHLMDDLDEDERAELAARGQRILILSILLNLGLNGAQRSNAASPLVLAALGFVVAVWSLLGVVKICSALGRSQPAKLTYMALSFVPLVNLVSLVVLSVRATRLLRSAGWKVGLFGARR